MQKERAKIYLIIAGALLFNGLFWNEKMAVNTVFYDLFLLGVLFFLYPNARHSSTVRWLLAGHLICLAMIVLHNTGLSKFSVTATLLLLTAFAQHAHRSVLFAGGSVIENLLFAVPGFFETLERPKGKAKRSLGVSKLIRFVIVPVLLAVLFFVIYSFANSVFLSMAETALGNLFNALRNFFDIFSWNRLVFFIIGIFVTTVIFLKSKLSYFSRKEFYEKDELIRVRNQPNTRNRTFSFELLSSVLGKFASGIMAIKNVNNVGLISLLFLNALLLAVNVIDIIYIWVGFNPNEVSLYKMVHEGANLLIISIVMAILVLLVFFKGNLNFYRRNKWLKLAAYAWIFQNMVLVISVFLRDYYYIREAGLGRNRIGILFYLLLVVIGLITVAWKIHKRKTTYYLFRVNAWAAIVLMIFSTTINWDAVIINYNLSRRNEIVLPVFYMVTLSDNVLPILDKNREELKRHIPLMKKHGFWEFGSCEDCWEQTLNNRIYKYKQQQVSYSWLSWSEPDHVARNYFQIEKSKKQ